MIIDSSTRFNSYDTTQLVAGSFINNASLKIIDEIQYGEKHLKYHRR